MKNFCGMTTDLSMYKEKKNKKKWKKVSFF